MRASATALLPLPEAPGTLTGGVAVHVYVSEEDAGFVTGAKRRKLLDKSAIVVAIAARHAETRHPLVLQLYPLRIADHAQSRQGTGR